VSVINPAVVPADPPAVLGPEIPQYVDLEGNIVLVQDPPPPAPVLGKGVYAT
jgi:hypothetical protein